MKKYLFISSVIIFFGVIFALPNTSFAAACPLATDTKINQNPVTGICFSQADPLFNPGLNTTGGSISACGTGGQVQCPGGIVPGLPAGNDCVVQQGTQCFAGHGPSGFNTPGCTASSTTPLPRCPSPMSLTMRAVDSSGNGAIGVTFTVTYADAPPGNPNGQSVTATSDPLGTAVISGKLYSGDHFIIVPSSPYWTFSPTQIGSNANIGQIEMNTTFPGACGVTLENGSTQQPCRFVATRTNVPLPTTGPNNPPSVVTAIDNTVNDTTNSLIQTIFILGGVGLVGYVVMAIGGGGRL